MEFPRFLQAPWLARVLKVGLAVLVLWVLAWAMVPWLLRVGLEKVAGEQLGRRLSVAAIDFRPWSLELTLHGLEVADADGQSVQLRLERLYLDAELQSLLRRGPVADALRIEGLRLRLTHLGAGRYDVDDILQRFTAAPSSPPGEVPRFALYNLSLRDAELDFVDRTAGKTHAVRDITLSVPFVSNVDALREIVTEPRLAFSFNGARFDSSARGTPFAPTHKTEARLQLARFDVRSYLAYWPRALGWRPEAGIVTADIRLNFEEQQRPRLVLSGTVAADEMRVAAPGGGLLAVRAARLTLAEALPLVESVRLSSLGFDGVRLTQGGQTPLALERLELAGLRLDGQRRQIELDRLTLSAPKLAVERDARGDWSYQSLARWLPAPAAASSAPAAAAPWQLSLGEVVLNGGDLRYADRAMPRAVNLTLDGLALRAGPWSSASADPVPFKLSGQVAGRRGAPGQFSVSGTLAADPLVLHGQLDARRLPVHALSPYLGDVLNVALLRADAGVRGKFHYGRHGAGTTAQLAGDAWLEDVTINTLAGAPGGDLPVGQELLSWKSLSLRGLDIALAPGQPSRFAVAETALSDFYARVIISPVGRINLQDVVKAPGASAVAGPPPRIRLGPVSLLNGRVQFADRFIKPNYSAHLTALTGRLGGFSSDAPQDMAELELRGRAEGTAELDIRGRLNPLAQPLALDIQGRVRDLELPPLSPYSIKYAGHGIERGKLAMDVSYQLRPDGQLQASNRLVLNQLTFGDPVEGAPASLPVRLAVALLADRNGVIDVDLPIRGSLNDPEFSLGPVIFKAVLNLVAKAVTAPFSLLASLFGGGEEQGVVNFLPGSSVLAAERRQALDRIADAMQQRPALTLTLAGSASLAAERDAFRRQRLDDMLQAEKRRAAAVAGKPAQGLEPVTAQERTALLREVYRRAQIPKPRNLIGLVKDVPAADMETLLLASVPVGVDQMRQLALARSEAVKDYLLARGLPAERLFLGAPKLTEAVESGWTPRVDMVLATP